jgi:hypothetical protein
LIARNFGMRRLAASEPHLHFDFVALLEKSAGGPHPNLQIVVIGARSQPHFLDLGDVLVLLGVASALVLLKLEFAEVGDAADGRIGGRRDFDQVEPCLFGAPDSFFGRHNANLVAIGVQDAYFGNTDLAIGTRTSGSWGPRDKWWSRNR